MLLCRHMLPCRQIVLCRHVVLDGTIRSHIVIGTAVMLQGLALSDLLTSELADSALFLCRWGRSPMVGNMVTTWQERMLDCTGMPRNIIAPANPINVAVIDRHYSAGRSFLNLPDVLTHLQVRAVLIAATHDLLQLQHQIMSGMLETQGHPVGASLVCIRNLCLLQSIMLREWDISACCSSLMIGVCACRPSFLGP